MNNQVTLAEAASFLGVSKQTLRNWDKAGKLKPQRDSRNNYRFYLLSELQLIKEKEAAYVDNLECEKALAQVVAEEPAQYDSDFAGRRLVGRLHNVIRDNASHSSIVERFDEIVKLLFLRALSEKGDLPGDLFSQVLESQEEHGQKLRNTYRLASEMYGYLIPEGFRALTLPDAALVLASPILESIPVSASRIDLKGLAFEEVVRNTFEKGDNQQFFTPSVVTEFIVSMLGEIAGGKVCDPACGTGGFLVEVLKQGWSTKQVTGLEIDPRLSWVTGVNLLVHGGESFDVTTLDGSGSLGAAGRSFTSSFDAIMTNPPFGSELTDQESLSFFELGRRFTSRRRGILFIEQCLNMLKPGGRLAIVIDEGVLSLPSASDVRDFLLERFYVEAVIGLPGSTFMPYASVNTSILIIKKEPPAEGALTFYAKAANVGRKPNGDPDYIYGESGERRLNNDLPEIVKAWKRFLNDEAISSDIVQVFGADIYRRIPGDDNRIDFQYHHPSRFDAIHALEKSVNPIYSLFDLCLERRESIIPRKEAETPTLRFTGLANIESYTGNAVQVETPSASIKSAVKKYQFGDILFARMRPNLRKCHLVQFLEPGFTSAECIVLTPRKDKNGNFIIEPMLLAAILRSDLVYGQIIHKVAGIGRPRISTKDLRQVRIPVPTREKQMALLESYREQLATADRLKSESRLLLEKAMSTTTDATSSLTSALSG